MMEKPKAGAQKGNKFATKLKEPAVRQEAYKQYCAHIASGMPKEAFFFSHPVHSVCWKTMERYISESPEEFPSFLMQQAKSARYAHWIEEGKKLMQGQYKAGSPVVWQTFMRNIFKDIGWDRQELQTTYTVEHDNALNAFVNQIKEAQDLSNSKTKVKPSVTSEGTNG